MLLNDGVTLPIVGFGTYLCSGEDVQSSVPLALEAGYVHIDTAEGYHNEEFVGQLIGGMTRKPFVTTKLWPGGLGDDHKTYEQVIESCKVSLKKLQIPCIDLYLIHLPLGNRASRLDQWRALLHLQSIGIVRSIGVSNYGLQHLEEISEHGLPLPVVNQLELHPLCQHRDIVSYCREKGIAVTAYSSLAPMTGWRTGQNSNKTDENTENLQGFNVLLQRIAKECSMSPSQVLLRWAIQHDFTVLPKSTNGIRIQQNLEVHTKPVRSSAVAVGLGEGVTTAWTIPAADMEALDGFNEDKPFAWPLGDPCLYNK